MALNATQQFYENVKQSKNPLILFKKDFNADIIASSLALALWLKKTNKPVELACDDFSAPQNLNFLPWSGSIKKEIDNPRQFIINLDVTETPVEKFSYKKDDGKLQIFITPKAGEISKENLDCAQSAYKHDLIFTINTPDLESLGKIYENHLNFFYNTPIINICNLPENELYGQLNVVNLTATSVAEILHDVFEKIDRSLIDEDIATCLLTGMIAATKSFRHEKVTPRSLGIASQLIASGAKRELIIKNLYQTKTVNTLKLWGLLLNNLETDASQKIAWSFVTAEDFKKSNASTKDLIEVIEELIVTVPTVEFTAIFFQTNGQGVHCLIKTEKNIDLMKNFSEYRPNGTKNLIRLMIDSSDIKTAEDQILEYLKNLIR
ncbi:MAG TPA: hypothetical protein VMX18_03020 [Candidatus Bipolaricaulota bacterium]|nr:hypothetical protein [Candidatus Bipolaricaulota bacterium]